MIQQNAINTVFITQLIETLFTGIDFKIKTVELRGKKIKLQIWDTGLYSRNFNDF